MKIVKFDKLLLYFDKNFHLLNKIKASSNENKESWLNGKKTLGADFFIIINNPNYEIWKLEKKEALEKKTSYI